MPCGGGAALQGFQMRASSCRKIEKCGRNFFLFFSASDRQLFPDYCDASYGFTFLVVANRSGVWKKQSARYISCNLFD